MERVTAGPVETKPGVGGGDDWGFPIDGDEGTFNRRVDLLEQAPLRGRR